MASDNFLGGANAMLSFLSLFASRETARAQRSQGDFEAQQFLMNSKLADIQAEDAIRRGSVSAGRVRSQGKQLAGSQRAAFAGSGVDVGSQTVQAVTAQSELFSGLDAITVESNAFREAFGFRSEALASRSSAEIAKQSSRVSAGNTLITGGLKAAQFSAKGLSHFSKKNNNPNGVNGTHEPVTLIKRKRLPGVSNAKSSKI